MTKLWAMRGYSGSGKSYEARRIAERTGAVVVCHDELRKMLLGSYWTGKKTDEDRVTVAEEAQVTALLLVGVDVIVDATHLHPPYLRRWARLATRLGVEFEVVDVRTDRDECVWRDVARGADGERYVGLKIIHDQAKRWPQEKWPTITSEPFVVEPVEWDDTLPEAIIVDIDGTLAHTTGRSPYDYSRVGEDVCDEVVRDLVSDWLLLEDQECPRHVLVVSGRDHTCRNETLSWLNRNGVPWWELWMRDANAVDERGNKLPDYIVKYDIFNTHIRGQYNVRFVLDDRDQVVDMWRKLGLKCLQVQSGNF